MRTISFGNAIPEFGLVCLCLALCLLSGCGGVGSASLSGTTPVAAVSISVSPVSATLSPGANQTFTATVNNATNTAVGWMVNGIVGGNSTFGTIDKNGNYAAPIFVPTPPAVTITAVSEADSTKTANASANISGTPIPVTITISPTATAPATVTVNTGQTLLFSASITGVSDTSVSWEINGAPAATADSSFGAIASAQAEQSGGCALGNGSQDQAIYTAPTTVPSGKQVTITAVSNAYPSVTASSTITITKGPTATGVYITPNVANIYEGQSLVLTADVVGLSSPSVSWSVPEGQGSIVAGCNGTATYTAPASVSGPTTVQITAVSSSNSSDDGQANITVSIPPPNAVVTLSPLNPSVSLGNTIQFTASVTGASDTSIGNWLLNGLPSSTSSDNLGTLTVIDATHAAYTAPLQIPGEPITITAVSNANPLKSASTTVTVTASTGNAVVTVAPNNATLFSTSSAQVFTASVAGVADTSVSWTLDGTAGGNSTIGTIQPGNNNTVTYTPPASIVASSQVTLKAESVTGGLPGTATINLEPNAPPKIVVTVTPSQANVVVGATQQYSASVPGVQNQTVTWQVNHLVGGNLSTTGSIDVNGNFTAPATIPSPATVEIEAVSNQDGKTTGTATATIVAAPVIQVALTPLSASVQAGLEQQFTATVTGTNDPGVSFAVNGEVGGDSTIGTISGNLPVGNVTIATYLAPATVPTPSSVQITAISAADGVTTSPAATVTITSPPPPIQVDLTPTTQTLIVGQSQIFTAVVTNTPTYTVSWALSGQNCSGLTCGTIVDNGTNPASATYTAPQTMPTPNNNVTVTATATADSSSQATATVTVEPNLTPSIAILPASATLQAGSGNFSFSAVIQNAPPDTEVTWTLGCISLYDGDTNNACFDLDFDGDGPGCLTMPAGFKKCGAYAQSAAGNEPVAYTPPEKLYTNAFQENACQTTNQGIAQVPLTAAMTVDGTLYTSSPPVCITITPP